MFTPSSVYIVPIIYILNNTYLTYLHSDLIRKVLIVRNLLKIIVDTRYIVQYAFVESLDLYRESVLRTYVGTILHILCYVRARLTFRYSTPLKTIQPRRTMADEATATSAAGVNLEELKTSISTLSEKIVSLKKDGGVDIKDTIATTVTELLEAKKLYADSNGGIGVDGKPYEAPMTKAEKKAKIKAEKAAKVANASIGKEVCNMCCFVGQICCRVSIIRVVALYPRIINYKTRICDTYIYFQSKKVVKDEDISS